MIYNLAEQHSINYHHTKARAIQDTLLMLFQNLDRILPFTYIICSYLSISYTSEKVKKKGQNPKISSLYSYASSFEIATKRL